MTTSLFNGLAGKIEKTLQRLRQPFSGNAAIEVTNFDAYNLRDIGLERDFQRTAADSRATHFMHRGTAPVGYAHL